MENKLKSLDFLFEQAKEQTPKSSFNQTKELFDANLDSNKGIKGKGNSIFNLKTLLVMIGIGGIAAITAIALTLNQEKKEIVENELIETEIRNSTLDKIELERVYERPENQESVIQSTEIIDDSIINTTTTFRGDENTNSEVIIERKADLFSTNSNYTGLPVSSGKMKEEPYRFPVLNEEEKKEIRKEKNKMLKALYKMDKKKYAFVPTGSYKVNDQVISVHAFFMQNTEVSNLEYRTFLFDLLIQDRKSDFLVAMPDVELWNSLGYAHNDPMAQHYFSHPAYDNYPVNNISREGAEMYCEWLTMECRNKYEGKSKYILNDVRLPTDAEWMWAAYGDNDGSYKYPWGSNSLLKPDSSCYLANYKPLGPDSTGKMVNKYFLDGGFYTVSVNSYYPNNYGLYNMSGNVAEMVYYQKEFKSSELGKDLRVYDPNNYLPGTKGGGWMSDAEELEIAYSELYKGETKPNLNVGFRPVMSYLSGSIEY
ncbi:MAG: formylglycine-generating enzyme family protein [Crocinitomicaceae bacterium]|nr:formylglycine-generating enzyme family protein [Crocinitomicaceae bacterium]